jgi:hypothetical protein
VGGVVGTVGGGVGGGSAAAAEALGPLALGESFFVGWAEFGYDMFTPAPYTDPNDP